MDCVNIKRLLLPYSFPNHCDFKLDKGNARVSSEMLILLINRR